MGRAGPCNFVAELEDDVSSARTRPRRIQRDEQQGTGRARRRRLPPYRHLPPLFSAGSSNRRSHLGVAVVRQESIGVEIPPVVD